LNYNLITIYDDDKLGYSKDDLNSNYATLDTAINSTLISTTLTGSNFTISDYCLGTKLGITTTYDGQIYVNGTAYNITANVTSYFSPLTNSVEINTGNTGTVVTYNRDLTTVYGALSTLIADKMSKTINEDISAVKNFTNGILAGGVYVNGTVPIPTDKGSGVTMGYSAAAAMHRLLAWTGSTYAKLGVGAYSGGKVSAEFNTDGTVKFNFNVTAPNISTTKALSILTSAWVTDTTHSGYGYRATVVDANITMSKDVDVAFDMSSVTVAQTANIGGATTMYNGGFYLYAQSVPSATLTGTYTVKAVA